MAEVIGKAHEEEKITLLKGWTKSAATYCIINETHTIGNTLRWMLMKNPKVEFCGY
ncbi:RNA polymerase subunit AC19, partial [Ceratobasidium sp. 428]